VRSYFLLHRTRHRCERESFTGTRNDILRREGDALRIASREIVLDEMLLMSPNLSVFFWAPPSPGLAAASRQGRDVNGIRFREQLRLDISRLHRGDSAMLPATLNQGLRILAHGPQALLSQLRSGWE
jgi:hypothetical protein